LPQVCSQEFTENSVRQEDDNPNIRFAFDVDPIKRSVKLLKRRKILSLVINFQQQPQ